MDGRIQIDQRTAYNIRASRWLDICSVTGGRDNATVTDFAALHYATDMLLACVIMPFATKDCDKLFRD